MTSSRTRRPGLSQRPGARPAIWPWLVAVPFAGAGAWVAYSALAVDHEKPLPQPVPGKRHTLNGPAGRLSMYGDGPREGMPLLLLHSINAAASAYEVRPLYMHYAADRPVYALDMPGFGLSSRDARPYTPRLMTDAIHSALGAISARHGGGKVDVMALSLTCEYAARAAIERPGDFRSLGLISPTGFDKALSGEGPTGTNRGKPWLLAALRTPLLGRAILDLFVSRPSMRKFLERTWGSSDIDEGLFAYDQKTSHQPGAKNAVLAFIAGQLFPNDATRLYKRLDQPVWTCHGTRGAFTDFRHEAEVDGRPNWHFDEFDTGAFPQFERLDEVVRAYGEFLHALTA